MSVAAMRIMAGLAAVAMVFQPVAGSARQVVRPPLHETRCDLGGWTASMDGALIPVRAAPRPDARLLGTLPTAPPPGKDITYAVDFAITGSRAGWLKIADASDAKNEPPARRVFGGWAGSRGRRRGSESSRRAAMPSPTSAAGNCST